MKKAPATANPPLPLEQPPSVKRPKRNPSVDGIVRAAYRKHSHDKLSRKAMRMSMETEDQSRRPGEAAS